MISNALFNEFLFYMKKNGALFFEMYYDETETSSIDIINGQVHPERIETMRGVSLRAFDGENHICMSTEDLTDSNLRSIVHDMAKHMRSSNHKNIMRCDIPETIGTTSVNSTYDWTSIHKPIVKSLSIEQKNIQERFRRKEAQVNSRCFFQNQKVQLLNSFNGVLYDNRSRCCVRTDAGDSRAHITSILAPISYDELIRTLQSKGLVCGFNTFGKETAKCPTGKFDLVLQSGSSSLFFHECCGHLLEVYYAMQPDGIFNGMIGKKIANECVSLCDSGRLKNLWGSISVDDEGNPAQENVLIQDGVLISYLVDLVGGYKYDLKMTSNTRRQCYRKMPTARMTNTYIMKGICKEEDVIKDTQNGLLIRSFNFGNVNPLTGDFSLHINAGNFIKNGIIGEPFRGGQICENALSVLSRIDMVADNLSFTNGFCYATSGRITVSGGQPTLRISDVFVYNKD